MNLPVAVILLLCHSATLHAYDQDTNQITEQMKRIRELQDELTKLQHEQDNVTIDLRNLRIFRSYDKCLTTNPCYSGVHCYNTNAGPKCDRCPIGMWGDGHKCQSTLSCSRNYCSMKKSETTCPSGYVDKRGECRIKNYCNDAPCGKGKSCVAIVSPPYYRCISCGPGLNLIGDECHDINECEVFHPCDLMTKCENRKPGFYCTPCPKGYNGTHMLGFYSNQLPHNYERQTCNDVNECTAGGQNVCPRFSQCINKEGSYDCKCMVGFQGDAKTIGCHPKGGALCDDEHTMCDKNAHCQKLPSGDYQCNCIRGWAGNGFECGRDRDLDGLPDSPL